MNLNGKEIKVTIIAAKQADGKFHFLPKGFPTFFVKPWENWSINGWKSKHSAIAAGRREFANFL